MEPNHIPMIMEFIDNNIIEDRKRKYSNALIVKILVILQIYGISYRSAESFFRNHPDLKNALGLENIPNFRTLSRRATLCKYFNTGEEIINYYNYKRMHMSLYEDRIITPAMAYEMKKLKGEALE